MGLKSNPTATLILLVKRQNLTNPIRYPNLTPNHKLIPPAGFLRLSSQGARKKFQGASRGGECPDPIQYTSGRPGALRNA